MFKRIAKALKRAMKRFLRNDPINAYEHVAFKAFRDAATVFGRVA